MIVDLTNKMEAVRDYLELFLYQKDGPVDRQRIIDLLHKIKTQETLNGPGRCPDCGSFRYQCDVCNDCGSGYQEEMNREREGGCGQDVGGEIFNDDGEPMGS